MEPSKRANIAGYLEHLRQIHFSLGTILAISFYLISSSISDFIALTGNLEKFDDFIKNSINSKTQLQRVLINQNDKELSNIINRDKEKIQQYILSNLKVRPSYGFEFRNIPIRIRPENSIIINPPDDLESIYNQFNHDDYILEQIDQLSGLPNHTARKLTIDPFHRISIFIAWPDGNNNGKILLGSRKIGSAETTVERKDEISFTTFIQPIKNTELRSYILRENKTIAKYFNNIRLKSINDSISWSQTQLTNSEGLKGKTFKIFDIEFDSVNFAVISNLSIFFVLLYYMAYLRQLVSLPESLAGFSLNEISPWVGLIKNWPAKIATYFPIGMAVAIPLINIVQYPHYKFFFVSLLFLIYFLVHNIIKSIITSQKLVDSPVVPNDGPTNK